MLKEQFISRNPTHFQVNPVVKSFIISEGIIWSAWNFLAPVFAIFLISKVQGGSVELVGIAYSFHLIARVIVELANSKYLSSCSDKKKLNTTIIGLSVMTFGYLGIAFSQNVLHVFIFYTLLGVGMGIAAPAKSSLFSTHLDKNREASEWGIYDAVIFIGMALSAALGGFIAKEYGFTVLFVLSAVVNLVGIGPYFLFKIR